MSDNTTNLLVLLADWFERGDESAYERAYRELAGCLFATPEVVKALSRAVTDEVRQDVLTQLLDKTTGDLRDVQAPVAYARTVWRRALVSVLRKWGPRPAREDEVRRHVSALVDRDDCAAMEARLDASRAIDIAATLGCKGRLAILLTTRPDRIADEDWLELVASLPPPPPQRPIEPLDREDASMLLYPPHGPEDSKRRNQRLNSFDKSYTRAAEQIRKILDVKL